MTSRSEKPAAAAQPPRSDRRGVTGRSGPAIGSEQTCADEDLRDLNLWIAADNIRKGAATNAVQIAEILVRDGLL